MQTRRQLLRTVSGGSVVGLAGAAGCLGFGSDDGPVENTQEVDLTEDGFDPKNIRVSSEQTAYWRNISDTPHVLIGLGQNFRFRQRVDPDMTTGYQFFTQGVYRLVGREITTNDEGEEVTPTGTPEFTGKRMKIAVGQSMDDPVTE